MKKGFNPVTWLKRGLVMIALSAAILFALEKGDTTVKAEWPFDQKESREISLSEAWAFVDLRAENEESRPRAGILGDYIYIELEDETVRAKVPYPSTGLISDFVKFSSADLKIYENTAYKTSLSDRVFQLLPLAVILTLLFFFVARGATKSLGLSSSHEVVDVKDLKEGFSDVAGIDNARADLEEIVEFLKNPKKISSLGGRMPKGALFAGPPGTGKTLLARALAKEAGVPFMTIDASSVNQIFVGAGAMKIRSAFKNARKLGQCIIFIDEIDAMGRARGSAGGAGSGAADEKETTLNTLLVEMDGFDTTQGVFIIAATNRPDILDPALTRSGRFDRRIDISLPDVKGREEILKVHMGKIATHPDLSVGNIARTTYGFSGADLALLANEAAIAAALRSADTVAAADFATARDRMIVGRSSSDRQLPEQEREITAYHEAGHAFVACLRPHADPIEKATILPRGRALGYVMQMPDTDRVLETRDRLHAKLDVAVAGRVAEILFKGEGSMTTGAQSDIEQATRIARSMVEKWGMSNKGFVAIGDSFDPMHRGEHSTEAEVRRILDESMARVTKDMKSRKAAVERIAKALLEHETLDAGEIDALIRRRKA